MEAAALAAAAEQLSALCAAAGEFGIPEPPTGWEALEVAVRATAAGQAPTPEGDGRTRPHGSSPKDPAVLLLLSVRFHQAAAPANSCSARITCHRRTSESGSNLDMLGTNVANH